jgi:hypothetical protein
MEISPSFHSLYKRLNPTSDDVIFLKLITGEEIVAEKKSFNGKVFTLTHGLQIFLQPMPDGQVGVQSLPWPFAIDPSEDVFIDQSHVIFANHPNKDLINLHRERFGKIQIVSSALLHS